MRPSRKPIPRFVPQAPMHRQLQCRDNEQYFPVLYDQAKQGVPFYLIPSYIIANTVLSPRTKDSIGKESRNRS